MDARRVTRASVQMQHEGASLQPARSRGADGREAGALAAVKWPESGVLSAEWVQELGRTLDYASRSLQPSELPSVLPIAVIDSLLLAAHKVRPRR